MRYTAERCNEQQSRDIKPAAFPVVDDAPQIIGSGAADDFPLLVTPLCGVTGLFGALLRVPRRGAERRRMRYTAERCNE